MKKKLLIALPLAITLMFSGCATLFGGGGKQTISISSDSTKRMKAVISYEDGSSPQYLTIPGTVIVKRADKNIIVKSQDKDFEPKSITKDINNWTYANAIFAPYLTLPLMTTDYVSGALWTYDEAVTVHAKND